MSFIHRLKQIIAVKMWSRARRKAEGTTYFQRVTNLYESSNISIGIIGLVMLLLGFIVLLLLIPLVSNTALEITPPQESNVSSIFDGQSTNLLFQLLPLIIIGIFLAIIAMYGSP